MADKTKLLLVHIRTLSILLVVLCLSACDSSSTNANRSPDELNDQTGSNRAPIIGAEVPRVAEQGSPFVAAIRATDVDGDALVFSGNGLPAWLSLNADTGRLTGVPQQSDVGFSESMTFRVTDSGGLFDELTNVIIEVIDVNDAPFLNLSQFPLDMDAGQSITVRVFPDDVDNDGAPVNLMVEPNSFISTRVDNGSVQLTVNDVLDVTDINLVLIASDSFGATRREIVPLRLHPVSDSGLGRTLVGSQRGAGVNLVILGDGYRADQQTLLRLHAEELIDMMRSDQGIVGHLGAFNIHMIETVSSDSGADDSDVRDSRNTAFDSAYNCLDVIRLICANTLKVFETALRDYPDLDQIILLVNDLRFGGSANSGGSIAVTSAYSPEIALHELGHSLAGLADEYVDAEIVETLGPGSLTRLYPNIAFTADPERVPWKAWIDSSIPLPSQTGDQGVGVFEGGLYRSRGVFRPTSTSRMRRYNDAFGPVNSEQWILSLYRMTEGVRGFSPISDAVRMDTGATQEFSVSTLFGDLVQQVQWKLNGVDITDERNQNKVSIRPISGIHTLELLVSDISGAIRQPPPHAGIFSWQWQVTVQ